MIRETGLCVWRSGPAAVLDFKRNGDFLTGCLAILWTGSPHDTPGVVNLARDYDTIARSGRLAREGALHADPYQLAAGIALYHSTQLAEGMEVLPEIPGSLARKYCGGGHGGYALYLFENAEQRGQAIATTPDLRAVEPFCKV